MAWQHGAHRQRPASENMAATSTSDAHAAKAMKRGAKNINSAAAKQSMAAYQNIS